MVKDGGCQHCSVTNYNLKKKAKEAALTERNISSTFHAVVRKLSIFLKRANSDMRYVKSCLISFFSVR